MWDEFWYVFEYWQIHICKCFSAADAAPFEDVRVP